jgi:sugar phosphate isomerase/epimerase
MSLSLGYVSAIVPEWTGRQAIEFAAETGYACVELMCWPDGKAERRFAGVTHVDVVNLDPSRARDLRDVARHAGVRISALGYYPNLLSPDSAHAARCLDHLKLVIRAAALLEIGLVNTFAGRDPHRSVDENWPGFLKVWRPLVQFAGQHDVRLAIENCPMLFTADEWPGGKNLAYAPAIWRRIFTDIPDDHLGLNYDPSHLVWQRMDPYAPLDEFRAKLFHLHAKDVRIDPAALNDHGILATPLTYHQPRIPGCGEIDWPRFLRRLHAVGYVGPVCVEVEDDTFGRDLEGRLRALRAAHAHLHPLFSIPQESHR